MTGHGDGAGYPAQRILITGAAGGMGRLMRPRLRRDGRVLRLLDVADPAPAEPGERVELVTGSVTDPAASPIHASPAIAQSGRRIRCRSRAALVAMTGHWLCV